MLCAILVRCLVGRRPIFPASDRFLPGLQPPGPASAELRDVGPGAGFIPPDGRIGINMCLAPHQSRVISADSRQTVGRSAGLRPPNPASPVTTRVSAAAKVYIYGLIGS